MMDHLEAVAVPEDDGDISDLLVPVAGDVEYAAPVRALHLEQPQAASRNPPPRETTVPAAAFVTTVRAGRFYDALGLTQAASGEEVRLRLQGLWQAFSSERLQARPSTVSDLDHALAVLQFLGGILLDAHCREVADRVLLFREPPPDPADATLCGTLRQAWGRLFPGAASCSSQLARQAYQAASQGDFASAHEQGLGAVAADPFNLSMLETVAGWRGR